MEKKPFCVELNSTQNGVFGFFWGPLGWALGVTRGDVACELPVPVWTTLCKITRINVQTTTPATAQQWNSNRAWGSLTILFVPCHWCSEPTIFVFCGLALAVKPNKILCLALAVKPNKILWFGDKISP